MKNNIVFPDDGREYKTTEYLNLDGFYPGYFKATPKILFVGRESREASGCNRMETDLEFLQKSNINGFGFQFWQRLFRIVYGVEHEGQIPFYDLPSANDIKNEYFAKNNFPFAFINLSKYSNDSNNWSADSFLINRFLEDAELDRRNFLREQITILDPDVIISCNLWGNYGIDFSKLNLVFPDKDFSQKIENLSSPDGVCDVYNYDFEGKTIRFIDLYHFSASRVREWRGYELDRICYYDAVMNALFG